MYQNTHPICNSGYNTIIRSHAADYPQFQLCPAGRAFLSSADPYNSYIYFQNQAEWHAFLQADFAHEGWHNYTQRQWAQLFLYSFHQTRRPLPSIEFVTRLFSALLFQRQSSTIPLFLPCGAYLRFTSAKKHTRSDRRELHARGIQRE